MFLLQVMVHAQTKPTFQQKEPGPLGHPYPETFGYPLHLSDHTLTTHHISLKNKLKFQAT